MNIIEVLKSAGIEVEADKADSLTAAFETSLQEELKPLKSTVAALRQDKDALKEAKTAEEQARLKAEQEAMAKAGDIEGIKNSMLANFESEKSSLHAEINTYKDKILGGESKAVIAALQSRFVSPDAGAFMLNNMIESAFDEKGNVQLTLKDMAGTPISTDPSKFSDELAKIEALKPYLSGVDSSGGGGQPGNSSGGSAGFPSNKEYGKMTAAEKVAYLERK